MVLAAAGLAVSGCADTDERSGSLPPSTNAPAADLAPSQTTADTIAAPALPPPCDPALLELGAATGPDGGLVVRIENRGDERCEVDLAASPIVDPAMEPDVWLDAGAVGELLVAVERTSCPEPAPVDAIGLVVSGEPLAVAIDPIEACTLVLTALYPL